MSQAIIKKFKDDVEKPYCPECNEELKRFDSDRIVGFVYYCKKCNWLYGLDKYYP